MTPQERNEAMLLNLWRMGELLAKETGIDRTFRGTVINDLNRMVERAERPGTEPNDDECSRCFGFGEYITGVSDSDQGEVHQCNCGAKNL